MSSVALRRGDDMIKGLAVDGQMLVQSCCILCIGMHV